MSWEYELQILQEKRNHILNSGHTICNQISHLKVGQAICVDEDKFIQFWQYQYNPEKGETAFGEMNRWTNSLKEIGIIFNHNEFERRFYFKRLPHNPK